MNCPLDMAAIGVLITASVLLAIVAMLCVLDYLDDRDERRDAEDAKKRRGDEDAR